MTTPGSAVSIQQLLTKLPLVQQWIEETLIHHKATARPVASYAFPRLAKFYSAETLATTSVIEVPQVPMPPLSRLGLAGFDEFEHGDYAGITFLNNYFVQTDRYADESLHLHELVHVIQWQHLGPSGFIAAYAAGYLAAGNYRDNPLEVMAYSLQHYFDTNQPPTNVETYIRGQIDARITPLLQRMMRDEP